MVAKRCSLMVVVALVAAAGCTHPSPIVTQTPPPPELSGTIRSLSIDGSDAAVATLDLANGTGAETPTSIPRGVVDLGAVAATTTPDGAWFVGTEPREVHVYRIGDDQVPEPVGPSLAYRGSSKPQVVIGPSGAAVATCEGVFALRFASMERWERIGSGCWVALSEDGRSVAYAPRGDRLVIRPFVGVGRSTSVDLDRVLGPLLGLSDPQVQLVGQPAWGAAGLAFSVGAQGQVAVFVRNPSGRIREVLQEIHANPYREPLLAWQPDGTVLAIGDDVGPAGAVLRVFDTADGSHHAIGSDVIGFAGLAWSPRGDALSVLTSASALIVMKLDGSWLLRRETDWLRLLSWTGAG
jgi:hypothetical protein